MASSKLDGVAFVTGAASGVGQETALCFAEAGASAVVFADINEVGVRNAADKSRAIATHPQFKAMAIRLDVTDEAEVNQAVDMAAKELGRIDYGVNSAGIDQTAYLPFQESSTEAYEHIMKVNATGALNCTKALCNVIRMQEPKSITTRSGTREIGRGSIVNVSSALSYAAVPGKVGYITSKHALLGITKSAALDSGTSGVRVNMVCPTWVKTAMFDAEQIKAPGIEEFIKQACPFGRPAEAEEVAGVILFLSGAGASYITGIGMIIDAGLTLTFHLS